MKPIIYFLCTGNSCRSQMAEGFGKMILTDYDVYSAGIEAHGLNKTAVKVMNEVGIDLSQQRSELIDPTLLNEATYVITLCGDAEEKCPMTPPHVKRLHWPFSDPAKATGTEEEVLDAFRSVRDEMKEAIEDFAKQEK